MRQAKPEPPSCLLLLDEKVDNKCNILIQAVPITVPHIAEVEILAHSPWQMSSYCRSEVRMELLFNLLLRCGSALQLHAAA